MTPFFSICIPQHNRTSFLIEACRSLMAQSFRDFELCISDDASTDGRDAELQEFLKRSGLSCAYQRQERNLRYDANLRASIALAKGRYCWLMGNDDALASPDVLHDVHAALADAATDVALTNYEDYVTREPFRRVRRSGRLPGSPARAVAEFRNFSFVSGVILAREPAQRFATDRWDGSEMYQMYLACRMLAAGGELFGWEGIAVRKDIRLAGEAVDSYAQRPRLDPCPVVERRLPMGQIVRVISDAIAPYQSPEDQRRSVELLARQLLFFTYPFWIFEYRRVQSWRFALGVCLGMRPKNLLEGLSLSIGRRMGLQAFYGMVTAIGLTIPVFIFQRMRRSLYAIAKGAMSLFSVLYWIQECLRVAMLRLGVKYTTFFPIRWLQRRYVATITVTERRNSRRPTRILFLGHLDEGSTTYTRFHALKPMFHSAEGIDINPFLLTQGLDYVWTNHFYAGWRIRALNALFLETARRFKPDLIWVDRALHVRPSTLEALRADGDPWMIHFSEDNHQVTGNQTRHYFQTIPFFEVHVTSKPQDVEWLKTIGARRVEYLDKGFDPQLHRPLTLSSEERVVYGTDVGFTGHWEHPREDLLLWLKEQGVKLKIWGGGWQRARYHDDPLFRHAPHLYGDDYAKAIQGAKIQLCLVSEWFHDRTTCRSIEIPACGTFMLAERTAEHQALFKEGAEAEFYSTRGELLEKIRFYLAHDADRERIAQAGRQRCLAGYAQADRLRELCGRLWGVEKSA